MNFEEFKAKKENLIHYIIEFEQVQRKINLLSASYLLEFHKELEEQTHLKFESDGLIQGIAMLSNKKSVDEVKEFLQEYKKNYQAHQQQYYQKYNAAKSLEKQCSKYTPKDMETLDSKFMEYCMKYHPLVHIHATEAERNLYPVLITLYRMGNLDGFKSFLLENKGTLTTKEISPAEYEEVAKEYDLSIKDLQKMLSNVKQEFPLNKEDIFYKEELLTREQMTLREDIYQMRDMNKALHQDFLLQFPFDFKL